MPYLSIARDDFESGLRSGGTGWLDAWRPSTVFIMGAPSHSGSAALNLSYANSVERTADVSGYSRVRLRFWSRLAGLQAEGQALLAVRPNGGAWQVVKQFSLAESDQTYHAYDIDLSGIATAGGLAVAFHSSLSPTVSQWHVDDVELVGVSQ